MKYKIFFLVMICFLFLLNVTVNSLDTNKFTRVWQHEQDKKEVKTDDSTEFNTHLPIISIDTNGQDIPGEERSGITILSNIKIFDDETRNNYLTDAPAIESLANIKYRGRTSMEFDKKGYLIHLIGNSGEENNQEVMGMEKHNEWVLHGPFLDKTLIRNYLLYNLSGQIMEYAPDCRFCELFVNNEYQGLYLMVESIARGEGRINISKYKTGSIATSYIVKLDEGAIDPSRNLDVFGKYAGIFWKKNQINVEYPSKEKMTESTQKYIENDFSQFEKMLNSFDYKEYEKYIDVDSFVDYFLINEFTKNYDAGNLSTYLYKDVRGKLKFCVWDFNSACDNYQEKSLENEELLILANNWFQILFKDKEFTERVINRYYELRKEYFTEEYLNKKIDDNICYLGDAVERNFEVWGYTFDEDVILLEPEERNLHSYDEAVEQLKTFFKERIAFMDANIEHIRQYSHESVTKKYNH